MKKGVNQDNILSYFLHDSQKSFLLEMAKDIALCKNEAELLSNYEALAGNILMLLMGCYNIGLGYDADEVYERNNLVAVKKYVPDLYKCLPDICLSVNVGAEHHEKIREEIAGHFTNLERRKEKTSSKLYRVRSVAVDIKKIQAMFADASTLHEGLTYFEVELTPEQIIGLSEKYDVMIHSGDPAYGIYLEVYLDKKGDRFCKR